MMFRVVVGFFTMLLLSDLSKEVTGLVIHQQRESTAGVSVGIQRTKERAYIQ